MIRHMILALLNKGVEDAVSAVGQLGNEESLQFMMKSAELISCAFESGNKVIIAGNGGSLCDAMHFAEELTGFFRGERKALPAIALSEPGHITCTGNDLGFDYIFSRGVEAYGQPGDVFAWSDNKRQLPKYCQCGFAKAKKQNLKTVAFLGKGGGRLRGEADLELIIDGFKTSDRIQEAHMAAIHLIIELVEHRMFVSHN